MANLVVVSTTNSIKVDFGVLDSVTLISKGTWRKDNLVSIIKMTNNIAIDIQGQPDWSITHDGSNGTFQVDTIDGVAPITLDDLYNKMIAIVA